MPLADYSHHNEEASRIWYEEEGKHSVHVDNYEDEQDWNTNWTERDDDEDDYETEAKVDESKPETEETE